MRTYGPQHTHRSIPILDGSTLARRADNYPVGARGDRACELPPGDSG
jgi:hypothetical protein